MLYDTLAPEQVVDSEAALEFMKEATKLASAEELEDIGQRLETKSLRIQFLLGAERIDELDEADFKELVGLMFSLRRKGGRLLRANGIETLRAELKELLYCESPPGERLERFVDRIVGLEEAMILSLATESLHFSDPQRYWLWTHWIWNPGKGTGALALVTQDDIDLQADGRAGTYMNVGRATALINAEGHAAGYARSGRGLFGTDIFLACVYSVYMFTIFRVKLSQEFNRILPELPELVERVLGVHKLGASTN